LVNFQIRHNIGILHINSEVMKRRTRRCY